MINALLDKGADINYKDNWKGETILMSAVTQTSRGSSIEIIKLLLQRGADVNAINNTNGKTSLMLAARYSNTTGNLETVTVLLEHGADPFVINDEKRSAIDYCPTNICKEIIGKDIWKKLYSSDKLMIEKLNKEIMLSKDIWEIIMLQKRQQQLCKNLTSSKNREILVYFALELGIPVDINMTKARLCEIISKVLINRQTI